MESQNTQAGGSPGAVLAGLADPADLMSVGGKSTDVIPILWASRMLTILREEKPSIWRQLLGRASTGA